MASTTYAPYTLMQWQCLTIMSPYILGIDEPAAPKQRRTRNAGRLSELAVVMSMPTLGFGDPPATKARVQRRAAGNTVIIEIPTSRGFLSAAYVKPSAHHLQRLVLTIGVTVTFG